MPWPRPVQELTVNLTNERLAAIGVKANGWLSDVNLSTLSVRFGKPTTAHLPVNPRGDVMSVELVPLAVNITGKLRPGGRRFRNSCAATDVVGLEQDPHGVYWRPHSRAGAFWSRWVT